MRANFAILKTLVISMAFGSAAFAGPPVLEMIGGGNSVAVMRAGKEIQLKKGESLNLGDEVVTSRSSSVDIRLEDKTLIRVGSNSSYRYEEDSAAKKILHRLMGGIVRVLVPKVENPQGIRFQMKTPQGTIGVRGTEFVVIQEGANTSLKGLEGTVMFGPANADFAQEAQFVMVKKGFQSIVAAGGKPSDPAGFDLPAYLKELKDAKGAFGALAQRDHGVIKTRGASVAPALGATTPAAPKGSSNSLIKEKVKAEVAKAPSADPSEQLFVAAAKGDIATMEKALKAGADVNKPLMAKSTALHAAAANNKLDSGIWLIKHGAKVDLKDEDGRTPLMTVVTESASLKFVTLIIDAGAEEDAKDNEGHTALSLAKERVSTAETPETKAKYEKLVTLLEEDRN